MLQQMVHIVTTTLEDKMVLPSSCLISRGRSPYFVKKLTSLFVVSDT